MKTSFILLVATALMVVSCGGNGELGTDSTGQDKKETPTETTDNGKSGKDLGKMPSEKKFYQRMLAHFCQDNDNFKRKFGIDFNEKGFTVNKTKPVNDSVVSATGLHTYKNKNTNFKATIKRVAKDTYKITFEAEIEHPHCQKKRWDDTTSTITYKE